jgi:secreted trypsin-like serine protease
MVHKFGGTSLLWIILVSALVVAVGLLAGIGVAQYRDGKIIGGTAVPNGKYPFVAALLDVNRSPKPFDQQFCGGALIDQDSVLTAAHCVTDDTGALVPAGPLRVTIGRTVLNSSQGQKYRVASIFPHPRYNGTSITYDAAVLKLSKPVSGIAPVKLATAAQNNLEQPGRQATVAGWGNTIQQPPPPPTTTSAPAPVYPNRMLEAQVPLVSDTQAQQTPNLNFVPRLMVAAGSAGKDSCQGDSGGPMFARRAAGGYTQIGVTSYGLGCGAPGYPGVYAEVNNPSIRAFITNAATK